MLPAPGSLGARSVDCSRVVLEERIGMDDLDTLGSVDVGGKSFRLSVTRFLEPDCWRVFIPTALTVGSMNHNEKGRP